MEYPKIFDKESRPIGVKYPNPFRVLLAIVMTAPFGAHALHYGSIYYSNGVPMRDFFFTSWFGFIAVSFLSAGISVIFVWYVLYLQLRLYSALQYVIGGVILGVVIGVGAKASSTELLIMTGVAITINSWLFYLFAFWGIKQEQEVGSDEPEVDNYYVLKAEKAFAEENYHEAIDNYQAAVSQVTLDERHMLMYQQALRHIRND